MVLGVDDTAAARPATSSAGECGDKDQVSRMKSMNDSRGPVPRLSPFAHPLEHDVLKEASLQIAIRHGKVEVSPTLRAAVEEKVGRIDRFFGGMERAEVRFLEEHNPRIAARETCEVTVHGHGHIVRARASATDAFAAVDRVVDKLEHQMTKLKGKLVSRSHPRRTPADALGGASLGLAGIVMEDAEEA